MPTKAHEEGGDTMVSAFRESVVGTRLEPAVRAHDRGLRRRRFARRLAVLPVAAIFLFAAHCGVASARGAEEAHGDSLEVAQEPPPSALEMVSALRSFEPGSPELQGLALRFAATLGPGGLSADVSGPESLRRRCALRLLGTAGIAQAPELLESAMRSPDAEVRAEAAVWYKVANPDWRADAEIRALVEQAIAGDPAGGGS